MVSGLYLFLVYYFSTMYYRNLCVFIHFFEHCTRDNNYLNFANRTYTYGIYCFIYASFKRFESIHRDHLLKYGYFPYNAGRLATFLSLFCHKKDIIATAIQCEMFDFAYNSVCKYQR